MVSTSVWTWVQAAQLEIVEGHVLLALAGTDHPIDALEIAARSRLSLDAVYPAVNRLTGRGYTLEEHRLHGLTDCGRRLVAEFDRSDDLARWNRCCAATRTSRGNNPLMGKRVGILYVSIVVLALFAPGGAMAAPVPLPDDDPFYAQPAGLAAATPGSVLRSRTVSATAYGVPIPARAWQVLYRSSNTDGTPTANVATVIVPLTPAPGGKRPLLAYQTAEDGVGTKCAPSYALRAGPQAGATNSEGETGLIASAVARGWAVVAPDYEGPDSQFLGADGEARGVLDGVRAAKAFGPAGLDDSPVGMMGYSGGALATAQAAQLQSDYAPELPVAGIALGGVVPDVKATVRQFDVLGMDGVIVMGIVGVDRAYPEANVKQYFNAKGKAALAASAKDCITDAGIRNAGVDINTLTTVPDALDIPAVTALLWRMSPLGRPGTPMAPVYDYHATSDELAPIGPDRDLVARYCRDGVRVQHVEMPGEHFSGLVTGAPGALAYLGDRFAGKAAPSTC